jgi:hypothetical protein
MYIYSRPQQTGKTKLLIEWLMADPDNRVILVADSMQRDTLAKRLWSCWHKHYAGPDMDVRRDGRQYWVDRVVIPSNLRMKLQGRPRTEVSVDNIEQVLAAIVGQPVEMVTTCEPVLEYYEATVG